MANLVTPAKLRAEIAKGEPLGVVAARYGMELSYAAEFVVKGFAGAVGRTAAEAISPKTVSEVKAPRTAIPHGAIVANGDTIIEPKTRSHIVNWGGRVFPPTALQLRRFRSILDTSRNTRSLKPMENLAEEVGCNRDTLLHIAKEFGVHLYDHSSLETLAHSRVQGELEILQRWIITITEGVVHTNYQLTPDPIWMRYKGEHAIGMLPEGVSIKRGGNLRALCRCSCGAVTLQDQKNVFSGKSTRCMSCGSKRAARRTGMPKNSETTAQRRKAESSVYGELAIAAQQMEMQLAR